MRIQIASSVVAVACVGVVIWRAMTALPPPPLRMPNVEERAVLARRVAVREEEWRAKAAEDFPADAWSQRDAFQNLESDGVRDIARNAGVPQEEVFRAVDEDLHKHPNKARGADVVPLKPRPVFD